MIEWSEDDGFACYVIDQPFVFNSEYMVSPKSGETARSAFPEEARMTIKNMESIRDVIIYTAATIFDDVRDGALSEVIGFNIAMNILTFVPEI